MGANDNVRLFVLVVVDAALSDAQTKIPERHKTNTSAALRGRLKLDRFRTSPRNGDGYEARRIYTAARFLYRTEPSD
jgi:hypothetical protein